MYISCCVPALVRFCFASVLLLFCFSPSPLKKRGSSLSLQSQPSGEERVLCFASVPAPWEERVVCFSSVPALWRREVHLFCFSPSPLEKRGSSLLLQSQPSGEERFICFLLQSQPSGEERVIFFASVPALWRREGPLLCFSTSPLEKRGSSVLLLPWHSKE